MRTPADLPRMPLSGVVDADGHILEPPDLWERYLEPQYRERAVRIRVDGRGLETVCPCYPRGNGPAWRH